MFTHTRNKYILRNLTSFLGIKIAVNPELCYINLFVFAAMSILYYTVFLLCTA